MADKLFDQMTLPELRAEYERWNERVEAAASWGASLVAANSFRAALRRMIDRREAEIEKGNTDD